MKITELYKKSFVLSFEIFPPKTSQGEVNLRAELRALAALNPGFVSVTYGAGGSTRDKTLDIALELRAENSMVPLVHFTCVGAGRNQIAEYIDIVKSHKIDNILALRGDPPRGQERFVPQADGFAYADELVEYLKGVGGFCIGVAGYPEGHPEASDLDTDIDNLKRKIDAGGEYILTQFFYDNNDFFRYRDKISARGISVPVIPGIMPVTSLEQLEKITGSFGPKIPPSLREHLTSCGGSGELCQRAVDYTVKQCVELKEAGVEGFHFYTLNKAATVTEIVNLGGFR